MCKVERRDDIKSGLGYDLEFMGKGAERGSAFFSEDGGGDVGRMSDTHAHTNGVGLLCGTGSKAVHWDLG